MGFKPLPYGAPNRSEKSHRVLVTSPMFSAVHYYINAFLQYNFLAFLYNYTKYFTIVMTNGGLYVYNIV